MSGFVSPILNSQNLVAVLVIFGVFAVFLPLFFITVDTISASAQVPPVPSPPDTDPSDSRQPPVANSQQASPPTVSDGSTGTVEITSLDVGQEVPVGELAIGGVSSDNQETNCQVYADVNDIPPLQNASAVGQGGEDDFSKWTFRYTDDYQLIAEAANELTAKITCFDLSSSTPPSDWHSINVTGVATSTASASTTTGESAPANTEEEEQEELDQIEE
jgi:hypothetical protein